MTPVPNADPNIQYCEAVFHAATVALRIGGAPNEFQLSDWLDWYILRRRHFIWGVVRDEDVVQDVCWKVCAAASKSPHSFAQMVYEGRDKAWLVVVARRTKIDHLRRERTCLMPVREDGSPVSMWLPDPAPNPERQCLLKEVEKLYDERLKASWARRSKRTLNTPEAQKNREAVRRSRVLKKLRAMLL